MLVRPKILIADNDATNVQLLSDICEAENFDIAVAADGDEALKAIEDNVPDLVLLDVMMPNRDGFQVLQEIRSRPVTRALPVMLVTAISDDDAIREGYRIGANDYITKPFKVVELVARMRTLLLAAAYERMTHSTALWEVGDAQALKQLLREHLAVDARLPVALVLFQLEGLDGVEHAHKRVTRLQVLQRLAVRLRSSLRGVDSGFVLPPDLLGFVLVSTDAPGAEIVGDRLLQQLRLPVRLDELDFSIDARFAVAIADGPAHSPTDLLQRCTRRLASSR